LELPLRSPPRAVTVAGGRAGRASARAPSRAAAVAALVGTPGAAAGARRAGGRAGGEGAGRKGAGTGRGWGGPASYFILRTNRLVSCTYVTVHSKKEERKIPPLSRPTAPSASLPFPVKGAAAGRRHMARRAAAGQGAPGLATRLLLSARRARPGGWRGRRRPPARPRRGGCARGLVGPAGAWRALGGRRGPRGTGPPESARGRAAEHTAGGCRVGALCKRTAWNRFVPF
jgi:hypothetical protein